MNHENCIKTDKISAYFDRNNDNSTDSSKNIVTQNVLTMESSLKLPYFCCMHVISLRTKNRQAVSPDSLIYHSMG